MLTLDHCLPVSLNPAHHCKMPPLVDLSSFEVLFSPLDIIVFQL